MTNENNFNKGNRALKMQAARVDLVAKFGMRGVFFKQDQQAEGTVMPADAINSGER